MYNKYFGLAKNPFQMAPDPEFLFLTSQHREALAGLLHAVVHRKGFGVLTGDAGTGKTTLLAKTLQSVASNRFCSSIVFHPTLTPNEFLEAALLDFGIADVPESKALRLNRLHDFLMQSHRKGVICVLIVDEAHKLTPDLLEEVRLLGNLDYGSEKLLQILLVGQTELDEMLNSQHLRQLKQRIAVRLAIKPLAPNDVAQYIRSRWMKAGGQEPAPFMPEAIDEIVYVSKGIPRIINTVCDSALMLAFVETQRQVSVAHVREVASDLQLLVTTPFGSPGPRKGYFVPAAVAAARSNGRASEPAMPPAPAAAANVNGTERSPKAVPAAVGRGAAPEPERPLEAQATMTVPTPIRVPDFRLTGQDGQGFFLRRWLKHLNRSHATR